MKTRFVPAWTLFALLALLLPAALEAATARRPQIVTVTLQNGDRVTLRDAEFVNPQVRQETGGGGGGGSGRGRGGGGASAPPGFEPDDRPGGPPGNLPGHAPAGDRNPFPGRGVGSSPLGPAMTPEPVAGLGDGLGRYRGKLRRLWVVRADSTGLLVNLELVNGKRINQKRMHWRVLYGWERPGQQGKFHSFGADEIDRVEWEDY